MKHNNSKYVSIIIPVYNEETVIKNCLLSLFNQTYEFQEIIVIDDGSTDNTIKIISNLVSRKTNLKVLHQKHKGPGAARNFGASHAKGGILVFVDADMTFDKYFIRDLTKPIIQGKTIGTFSKNEMNANKDNIWSKCWNINRGWPIERLISTDQPDTSPVFRAILKKEFNRVNGFTSKGEYTDDWSLSEKLNQRATAAQGAVYYHNNPATLPEVWRQSQWFSTNKFISGNILRKIKSLIFYCLPNSILVGIYKSFVYKIWQLLFFRILVDFAVWISVIKSFYKKSKAK